MSTIAAIATPPGSGGIAVIRISGPEALKILNALFTPAHDKKISPWRMSHGKLTDADGRPLDDVLVVYMPAPATFTGEDVVELHCHGGQWLANAILARTLELGGRAAERGEFTKRAFLNGRIDLSQAEAVAEIIAAPSQEALRQGLRRLDGSLSLQIKEARELLDKLRMAAMIGLDFPDDEIPAPDVQELLKLAYATESKLKPLLAGRRRARLMREGAQIALIGPVNAGKSSLLNALSGENRALVTEIAGTTRDYLETRLDFDGLPATLIDTAGLRESADRLEKMGVDKTRDIMTGADLLLLTLDVTQPFPETVAREARAASIPIIIVANKCDLGNLLTIPKEFSDLPVCNVSALAGSGLEDLVEMTRSVLLADSREAQELAPNERQAKALEKALAELANLVNALGSGLPPDLSLSHLDSAAAFLGDILGEARHEELMDAVFSKFCIGK